MSASGSQLIQQALALLQERRTRESIACLRRAIELQPDSVEAWGYLSGAMILAGRHDEALRCVEQVVRLRPDSLEARWRLADRLVRLDRLDEAEAQYRAVLEDAPSCHDARSGLRYVEWRRKRPPVGDTARRPATDHEQGIADNEGAGVHDPAMQWRKAENERRARAHFERGDLRLTSLPVHVEIESTTRCNASCITCSKAHHPYVAEDLPQAVFLRAEQELLPTAVSVNLSGIGEPMLARRFDRFHEEAVRCGARVHVVTNASALSMARLERFARRTTCLSASMDGATRATFESIRRQLSFDRVVERLRLYKKMRDLYPEAGSTLLINFVATRRNIAELPALVDLAAELGAQEVLVIDLVIDGLPPEIAADHLSHVPERANRLFDEAARCARQRGVAISLPARYSPAAAPVGVPGFRRLLGTRLLPERGRFPLRCVHPWANVRISVRGEVHPCCRSHRVLGDLNLQSFAAIWNGRRYRRFRRSVNSSLPPPECRRCQEMSGINAGDPGAVRAREGLLVKLLYRAEAHGKRLLQKARLSFPWH